MKRIFVIMVTCLASANAFSQSNNNNISKHDPEKEIRIVDISCGECNFGLKGKSCDLAIRIKGKAYFVDGTNINDHGDSHAQDGFCNAVRKAEVQGELVDNRFKVSYFKLIEPADKKAKP